MDDIRIHARAMQRRCNLGMYLGRLRLYLSAACGLTAGAVLAVKLFWPTGQPWLWALAPLLPAAAIAAYVDARRRFFTWRQSLGWLDLRADAGGLVMALADSGGGSDWSEQAVRAIAAKKRTLPRLRLTAWSSKLAVWVAFLAASAFVPSRPPAGAASFNTVAGDAVATLQSRFEQVDRLGLLNEEDRQELSKAIDQLAKDRDGAFDQRNWQAMDAANQRLDDRLAEANGVIDAAAEPLKSAAGETPLSAHQQDQLAQAMGRLADSPLAGAAPPRLKRMLADLQKRRQQGEDLLPSDPAELARMIEEASQFLEQCEQDMCRQGCRQPGNGNGQGQLDPNANLDDFKLSAGTGRSGGLGEGECEGDGEGECERPGKGGISRGRGDAPMVWGDESSADGAKFQPRRVVGPRLSDDGSAAGVSVHRPNANAGSVGTGAARAFDPNTGSRTNRTDYSPAYRGPIRRYFSDKPGE